MGFAAEMRIAPARVMSRSSSILPVPFSWTGVPDSNMAGQDIKTTTFGPQVLAIIATLAFVLVYSVREWNVRRRMPPGPRGIPFLGNKHQVPASKPWIKFKEWNEQYGRRVVHRFSERLDYM